MKKPKAKPTPSWKPIRTSHLQNPRAASKAKTPAARIRYDLDLTSQEFADMLGVPVSTVRKWESGVNGPSGAARTLLAVVKYHPQIVKDALAKGI